MTTAKMKFLLGYNLKMVIPCGQWTFVGESLPGGILARADFLPSSK